MYKGVNINSQIGLGKYCREEFFYYIILHMFISGGQSHEDKSFEDF